jgi:hypothetical protein
VAAGLAWTGCVNASDGYSLEVGTGHENVKMVRLNAWLRQWERAPNGRKFATQIHWELGLAGWRAPEENGGDRQLIDVSATPVLWLSPAAAAAMQPYGEVGIGVHALSEHRIGERELATPYHFGSLIGAGMRWGPQRRYHAGIRVQHLSNAGVESPNPGINFTTITLGVQY